MTRETDYAIFERVFGGKLIRGPILLGAGKPNPGDVMDDEAAKEYSALGYGRPATVAHYSKSNAEAMAVLRACCEKVGPHASVSIRQIGAVWEVGAHLADGFPMAEAETLELAIGKFSLLIFP